MLHIARMGRAHGRIKPRYRGPDAFRLTVCLPAKLLPSVNTFTLTSMSEMGAKRVGLTSANHFRFSPFTGANESVLRKF